MFHRFADPEFRPHGGHDLSQLRRILDSVRRSGIRVMSIDDVVTLAFEHPTAMREQPPTISITIDDGYADLLAAEPVFREYDCPVTGFVVPEVIDGRSWFWWDQIDFVLQQSDRSILELELAGEPILLSWSSELERRKLQAGLVERLKNVPDSHRLSFLSELCQVADVSLPARPPKQYRVLQWEELRSAEARGLRFGAHTMTHPILSQCDERKASIELTGSIRRVQDELDNPSGVFCYPNGRACDFGAREIRILADSGSTGALSTEPLLVNANSILRYGAHAKWCLPRFAYEDRLGVIQRVLLG
jgi:peptidoglycan/xylan/chitin deacetylase (PgdA/CDA1 family)